MPRRQKLELTWIGKENRPRLEPRILLEDPEHSHHAAHRVSEDDRFDNILIHGDNLLALKALEADYAGKVKCVCIDPPYNTGSAFTHYDDGVEHSVWLSLMRDRLEIMRTLLAEDGTLWVFVDDNEAHYLKVMLDELFGRGNFVTNFVWQKVDSPNDNKVSITPDHDHLLCYAIDKSKVAFPQKRDDSILKAYRGPDSQGRLYRDRLLKKNGKNSMKEDRPTMYFPIIDPDGNEVLPIHDSGRPARWSAGKAKVAKLQKENLLIWKRRVVAGEERWEPYTREYAPNTPTRPWPSIWDDVDTMRQAKSHQRKLLPEVKAFDTVKPERVIERILTIATDPGDLVLDSFAGSGTTGAVAHKMGRRWIMVELHDHAFTHIVPRLKKVVDGEDPGGVTEANGWKGGGGFRTFRLAPSLMKEDKWGRWVVNPEYNAEMLAEALCKHEGFTYAPSDEHFWMHGHSTETDFLYVTTQALTADQLRFISDEVGPDRTLLILCAAWRGDEGNYANLTLKKIPNAVLDRCEWGRDDYSLNVASLPEAPPRPADTRHADDLPLFTQPAEEAA